MARRILAIDGGGIKGVIPAAFLAAIEEATGKRAADYFDLIAGTSTGGIIALGLGLGLEARFILELYANDGPRIFDQLRPTKVRPLQTLIQAIRKRQRAARQMWAAKYDSTELRSALERAFGDAWLGDSHTRLVIPAFDRNRREVHVFKTAHHQRFALDWKTSAVDVALATAAAPTFFPSHTLAGGISLLDGGVWANNPVGLATVEAVGILEWARDDLYVLSLGCSEGVFTVPKNSGGVDLLTLIEVLMLGQSRGATGTAKLLTGHSDSSRRVFRYDQVVPSGTFGLDTIDQIAALRGVGEALAREALPDIAPVFLHQRREEFVPVYSRGA